MLSDNDTFLDTPKAATFLGFSSQALISWRRQGRGPVYYQAKKFSSVRYKVSDLIAFQESMIQTPTG